MLNTDDGSIRWRWNNDYFENDISWGLHHPYQYENTLLANAGNNAYSIDLSIGKSIWKKYFNKGLGWRFFGYKESFFTPSYLTNSPPPYLGRILSGNIQSGEEQILLSPNFSKETIHPQNEILGYLESCIPIILDGALYLSIFFADPNEKLYNLDWYLGLYSVDQNQWVYKKQPSIRLADGLGVSPHSIIYNDKVLDAFGKTAVCHDLLTGKLVWQKRFEIQGVSVMGIVDNRILAVTQDEIIHCLDPETGSQFWELSVTANPSEIRELNGIAYLIGGGGRFFAIDVQKGEVIWDLKAPEGYGEPFMEGVRVVHGKNGEPDKLIVLSYRYAYCYQAAR
jgi:outer membrane protein assembly factor BamB